MKIPAYFQVLSPPLKIINANQRLISRAFIFFAFALSSCQAEIPTLSIDPNAPGYQIVFLGDLLLADAAQPLLEEHGYAWPFEQITGLIDGDYLIANLEGPITVIDEPWDPGQRWSYNAQPEAAEALAAIGIDAVGFSNNHAMDRGSEGIADTILHLKAQQVEVFGAGENQEQAQDPLLIETPHGTIGVVALSSSWGPDRTASDDQAGTIPLSKSSIKRGYQLAQDAGADWVIAYVHWGSNYSIISAEQHRWAAEFARAGYQLVIGHGAHSLQPIEIIREMPVLYSLGNFVFGTPGRFSEEFPGYGLVARIELGPEGFTGIHLECIQTDNQVVNFQPLPCTEIQAERVFETLYPDLIIERYSASLPWP